MNTSIKVTPNIPTPTSESGFLNFIKNVPWSIVLPVGAGVIGIMISVVSQIQIMPHGNASDEKILSNIYSFRLPFTLSILLLLIGFFVYQSVSGKTGLMYPTLFILTGLTFIIANIALLMSLYQVNVS